MADMELGFRQSDLRAKWCEFWLKVVSLPIVLVVASLGYLNFEHQREKDRQAQQKEAVDERKAAQEKQDAARKTEELDRKSALALREREIVQREKEFKLMYYGRRIDVYLQLCDLASKIPTPKGPNLDAAGSFYGFLSRACVVSDPDVLTAVMAIVNETQAQLEEELKKDGEKSNKNHSAAFSSLNKLNAELVKVCRKSLQDAFPSLGDVPAGLLTCPHF